MDNINNSNQNQQFTPTPTPTPTYAPTPVQYTKPPYATPAGSINPTGYAPAGGANSTVGQVSNPTAYNNPVAALQKKKKEFMPAKMFDVVFAALFFVCSFLTVNFAFYNGMNLGATIAFAVTFAVTTVYFSRTGIKFTPFGIICGVLSLAGSIVFSVYRDEGINTVLFLTCIVLFIIYLCEISGNFFISTGSYRMIFDFFGNTVANTFDNIPASFKSYSNFFKRKDKSSNVAYVFVGIIIAIPVLIFIVPLLMSSDAAYQNMMQSIISNIGTTIFQLVLSIIAFPFVLSFLVSLKNKARKPQQPKPAADTKIIPSAMAGAFLSAISFFYLTYLISQLAYFFSAFSGILPEGYKFTQSEYARRGFFEMCTICFINLCILIATMLFTKQKDNKLSIYNRIVCSFICLFSLLLVITALSKMFMYIDCYGMTKLRLTTSIFMVTVLAVILIMFARIYIIRVPYMSMIITTVAAVTVVSAFANLDGIIAKYNVDAYMNGKLDKVDVDYLSTLSYAAVPEIERLVGAEDKNVATEAKDELIRWSHAVFYYGNEDIDGDFRSFNSTTSKAVSILEKYKDKEVDCNYDKYGCDY